MVGAAAGAGWPRRRAMRWWRDSPASLGPSPIGMRTLVATSSTRVAPRLRSASPTISSERPHGVDVGGVDQVDARRRGTGRPAARRRRRRSAPTLAKRPRPPKVMVPRVSVETRRPERPSWRYSTTGSFSEVGHSGGCRRRGSGSGPRSGRGAGASPSNRSAMDERSQRVARRFEVPMLIAALLVLPVLAIQASDLTGGWQTAADVLDWLIWGAFLVELAVMLWVVPRRWWYLAHRPLDLIIVVFTFPLLPVIFASLRLFRRAAAAAPGPPLPVGPARPAGLLAGGGQVRGAAHAGHRARRRRGVRRHRGPEHVAGHLLGGHDGDHRGLRHPGRHDHDRPGHRRGGDGGEHRLRRGHHRAPWPSASWPGAWAGRTSADASATAEEELDILEQIADVQARVARLERAVRARLGPPAD